MESVYLLIPISVLLVFGIAWAFWWSVRSGQLDDLEGPGFRVLMDEDVAKESRGGAGVTTNAPTGGLATVDTTTRQEKN